MGDVGLFGGFIDFCFMFHGLKRLFLPLDFPELEPMNWNVFGYFEKQLLEFVFVFAKTEKQLRGFINNSL